MVGVNLALLAGVMVVLMFDRSVCCSSGGRVNDESWIRQDVGDTIADYALLFFALFFFRDRPP